MGAPEKIDIAASHRTRIGCSLIAQALGLSQYGTRYKLWEQYTNRTQWPELNGILRVDLGEPMETVIQPFAEELLGGKLRRDRTEYLHPSLPLIGHVDFRLSKMAQAVLDALGGPAAIRPVVDMKTSLGFGAHYRFGAGGTDAVDDGIILQLQGYTMLTGAELAFVVALVPGPELKVYPIRADKEMHAMIEDGIGEFWRCVETDTPPEPQSEADARQRWAQHQQGKIIEADEEVSIIVRELAGIKAEMKRLESKEKTIRDWLIPRIGDADGMSYGGANILTFRANKDSIKTDYRALSEDLMNHFEMDERTRMKYTEAHQYGVAGARVLRLAKSMEAK